MRNIKTIFGAPGCGKTTRLMEILEEVLTEYAPGEVAFVSFTRKGTYEGAERARLKFGYKETELPFFRTLHSIAFRTGNYAKTDMIAKKDYKAFSEAMGMRFTGYYTEEFFNNDDKYLFMLFLERNNPEALKHYTFDVDMQKFMDVKQNFTEYKRINRVVDFTEIIEKFIERDAPLPVKVAIIDEAQDLTTLQWQMCEVAFRNCDKVFVAGDDDQAIYEWSGADVDYFLNLPGEREILTKSYRLQKKILELSRTISTMISRRVDKQFDAVDDAGDIFFYNDINELVLNPGETYYFLSRNNFFLEDYANLLRKRSRVFTFKDKLSYDAKELAAINAFERMRKTGKITDTEEIKLKLFLRDKVDLSKPWFENLNMPNDTIAYYKDLIRTRANMQDRTLQVDTIHGVKGGEADNVVLRLDFTRAVRVNFENNPNSELRCLYVACTRAKKHLHIIHSTTKNGYDSYVNMRQL